MTNINIKLQSSVTMQLKEYIVNYLGGVESNLEWKCRTIAAHQPPKKEDLKRLESQRQEAKKYIFSEEGRKKAQVFTNELTKVYNILSHDPQLIHEYMGHKKYIFITGAMRTGGTFLTKKVFESYDLDINDFSLDMIHDSMPSASLISYAHKPNVKSRLLFDLAQFLVWAKREFKDSEYIIKKKSGFEQILPLLYSIFGDYAEYIVTFRHPVSSAFSMGKKRNFKVSAYESPEWWFTLVSEKLGITEEVWNHLNYVERFTLYWKHCYKSIAENRNHKQRLKFVTYEEDEFKNLFVDLADNNNANLIDVSDFNVIKRNYKKVWSDEFINKTISELHKTWELNGLSLPELKLQ